MSRAVNIDATVEHIVATAAKHKAAISAIEPLVSKGTRVVFMNANDTAVITRVYGARVITGPVTRTPWQPPRTR